MEIEQKAQRVREKERIMPRIKATNVNEEKRKECMTEMVEPTILAQVGQAREDWLKSSSSPISSTISVNSIK